MKIIYLLSYLLIFYTATSQSVLASSTPKIIVLGDSLTAGYGVEQEESFPYLTQKILEKDDINATLINAGISGSTTASALSRLKWQLKSKPSHLLIALGANDGLRGFKTAETRDNLEKTIVFAKSQGIKVLITGMKIPPNYGKKYTDEFEAIFPDLAKKHGIPLYPFLLEGVAGKQELNLADGIHPNPKGYEIIAKNISAFLKEHLKK